MLCLKCGLETSTDHDFCPKCGTKLKMIEPSSQLEQELHNENPKEYVFEWVKQFSYMTLKLVRTKVTLDHTSMTTESCTYYLGFIKGKPKTFELPYNNIKEAGIKKLITYSDMGFAALFIVAGFANPLFFLLAALFVWTGINTSIVITTGLSTKIQIPASSKSDAEEFVQSLNEIHSKIMSR